MRTLSSADVDLLRRLPPFAICEIDPEIKYEALHPLLDLGIGLTLSEDDALPRIDAVLPSSEGFLALVVYLHCGRENAALRAVADACPNPRALDLLSTAHYPEDIPF